MIRQHSFSRKIIDFKYDSSSLRLVMNFKAGISKTYLHVPQKLYDELCNSTARDQLYQDKIDGHYQIL